MWPQWQEHEYQPALLMQPAFSAQPEVPRTHSLMSVSQRAPSHLRLPVQGWVSHMRMLPDLGKCSNCEDAQHVTATPVAGARIVLAPVPRLGFRVLDLVNMVTGKHAELLAHPVPGLSPTQVPRHSFTGGKPACLPLSTQPMTWVLDLQAQTVSYQAALRRLPWARRMRAPPGREELPARTCSWPARTAAPGRTRRPSCVRRTGQRRRPRPQAQSVRLSSFQ